MQPVLGLIEGDALRALQHLMGDFFAAMRRQTMHDYSVLFGQCDRSAVDLVGTEGIHARLCFFLLAHASPYVGVNCIRARNCFFDGMSYRDIGASVYRFL